MSVSLTNLFAMAFSRETALGVDSGVYHTLEPNPGTISRFGAAITKVARNPISASRQRRAGATVDLDSGVEFEHDLTMQLIEEVLPNSMFSDITGPVGHMIRSGTTSEEPNNLAAVATGNKFTHDALSAAIAVGTLVRSTGFATAVNNTATFGVVNGSPSTTETPVASPTLVNETPTLANGAKLQVCGRRIADLTWTDASNTIGSAGTDLTTLGLVAGQCIHIGSTTNQFANGRAFARILTIAAAAITVDKVSNTTGTGLDGGGDQGSTSVDLLYGGFMKIRAITSSDYREESITFEGAFANLDGVGTPSYTYPKGNLLDTFRFNFGLANKATVNLGFIGTDTANPTTSRDTGGSTPVRCVKTEPFNTSSDFARLRIEGLDAAGLAVDFKSMSLTVGNEVTPSKALATLGARYMNFGNTLIDLEAEALFTEPEVIAAIRGNTTITMDGRMRNGDGGFAWDIPGAKIGGGGLSFPENEEIRIATTLEAFEDATYATSITFSLFPYLPAIAN